MLEKSKFILNLWFQNYGFIFKNLSRFNYILHIMSFMSSYLNKKITINCTFWANTFCFAIEAKVRNFFFMKFTSFIFKSVWVSIYSTLDTSICSWCANSAVSYSCLILTNSKWDHFLQSWFPRHSQFINVRTWWLPWLIFFFIFVLFLPLFLLFSFTQLLLILQMLRSFKPTIKVFDEVQMAKEIGRLRMFYP